MLTIVLYFLTVNVKFTIRLSGGTKQEAATARLVWPGE
jgi:hypothetical protein